MRYGLLMVFVSLLSFSCQKEFSNGVDFSPNNPRAGHTVRFDCPGTSGYYYSWDFGDGTTAYKSYSSASHTYSVGGTYYVTVNLDQNGTAVGSYYATVDVR